MGAATPRSTSWREGDVSTVRPDPLPVGPLDGKLGEPERGDLPEATAEEGGDAELLGSELGDERGGHLRDVHLLGERLGRDHHGRGMDAVAALQSLEAPGDLHHLCRDLVALDIRSCE